MRTEQITYPKQYVVFDTETTGLDVKKDLILEIAAHKVIDGGEETKSWLLNWGITIPDKITEITGITKELCEKEGVLPVVAFREFMKFSGLSEFSMPVVGHNIYRFDIPMLFNNLKSVFPGEIERLGAVENFALEMSVDTAAIYKGSKIDVPKLWSDSSFDYGCRVLDTKVFGLKYNLSAVVDELGIDKTGVTLHRASGDVFLTNKIYKKLCLG